MIVLRWVLILGWRVLKWGMGNVRMLWCDLRWLVEWKML